MKNVTAKQTGAVVTNRLAGEPPTGDAAFVESGTLSRDRSPPGEALSGAPDWRSVGEREAYAQFGKAVRKLVVECYQEDRIDEWGDQLTELMAKFDLARRDTYDSEKHGDIYYCEPGDQIWWLGDWVAEYPLATNHHDQVPLPAANIGLTDCGKGQVP